MVRLVVLCLLASFAHAQPRAQPFVAVPGIPLGARVTAAGFCDTAQRAVFVMHTGDVVGVDASGATHALGKAGTSIGPVLCDRSDRVTVFTAAGIVSIGGTTSISLKASVRHARFLADERTIAFVDLNGDVFHFDGTTAKKVWKTKAAIVNDNIHLDPTGDRLALAVGASIAILDRQGKVVSGPPGQRPQWLDERTIVYSDRTGGISRWNVEQPVTGAVQIYAPVLPNRFARLFAHRAGSRMLVQQPDNILAVLDTATNTRHTITRLPFGIRIAAGTAPFAVIAFGDRALVVDLQRSSAAISHGVPLSTVSALAFSPDGRRLALMGGDRDVLVIDLAGRLTARLVAPNHAFIRQPLRWAADGTLFAGHGIGQVRWNLDGTTELQASLRSIGVTPEGDPIVMTRERKLVIERRHAQHVLAFDHKLGIADVNATERYVAIRTNKHVEVRALDATADAPPLFRTTERRFLRSALLVGDGPDVLYVDELSSLYLATPTSETFLGKLDGFPMIAATADRTRIAIAANQTIDIYDHRRTRGPQLKVAGRVAALAWSPDRRTLAVSTDRGVELWTIPR